MNWIRTRFGRAKFGGTPETLIALSPVSGIIVAVGFGSVVAPTRFTGNPLLAVTVFSVCIAPVSTAGARALTVDRGSIAGAAERPGESIENHWYTQGAQDTFHTALIPVGVLGVASVFLDFSVSGSLMAIYVGSFLMGVFAVAFGLRRLRDSGIVDNRRRQLREQHGLSQQKLADALRLSRQTVISIEKGRYTLPCPWRSSWPNASPAASRT